MYTHAGVTKLLSPTVLVCCEFEFDVFCICDVIELATALECQKQLLMSSISNLGRRESLEIAVNVEYSTKNFAKH